MSPEQVRAKELDARTDLFSFGVVLYEMSTGVLPFRGESTGVILKSILDAEPSSIVRLNPDVPPELEHIINKALEKDRDTRYQSAAEMLADLKRLKRNSSSGKAPISATQAAQKKSRWPWIAVPVGVLALGTLLWAVLPTAVPKVSGVAQITHDGYPMSGMLTDGSRIYVSQLRPEGQRLAQVAVTGGETSVIPTTMSNLTIDDISADRTGILANIFVATGSRDVPLWLVPLPAGSPRKLGNLLATDGGFSRDGRQLVFTKGTEVYLANADGIGARHLASMSSLTFAPRFSPNGDRIRFSTQERTNSASIWEVRADGSDLHQILKGWHTAPNECCGRWTEDGRYYVFLYADARASYIFALADSTSIFRKTPKTPVQLTTGPMSFSIPTPDVSGHKVFVQGFQPRGELVRYDAAAKQFVPYLGGISASDVAFSRDGQWVAYISIPDLTLWRSRVDGSERLQLATSASLPSWSPDGSQIAYVSAEVGKPIKIYLVSSQGGTPEELLPETQSEVDATWSPDGTQLAFGRVSLFEPATAEIFLVDLKTRKVTPIPGSKGLFSPRWSPDGRYLSGVTAQGSKKLMLYDFKSQSWSEWITEASNINYAEWSADSRSMVYDSAIAENPKCHRARLGEHHAEDLYSLNGLRRFNGTWGNWSGFAPDGSRLYLRDTSTQDIYALEVEFP